MICSQGQQADAQTCECTGGDPCAGKDCSSFSDACHDGVCVNGTCQAQTKQDGTSCRDQGQTCQNGQCTPPDPCDGKDCSGVADACNDGNCANGSCVKTPKPDGTPCGSSGHICSGGMCVVADPCAGVDCSSLSDACRDGVCAANGTCVAQAKPDGTTCGTQGQTCQGGSCNSADPCAGMNCSSIADACHDGVCQSGQCKAVPKPDGTSCGANGECQNGCCNLPQFCSDEICASSSVADRCNDGVCDPCAVQCVPRPKPDGTSCGAPGVTCQAGICVPTEHYAFATAFGPTPTRTTTPVYLTTDGNGNVYVTDRDRGTAVTFVVKYDNDGAYLTEWQCSSCQNSQWYAAGIAVGPTGNIVVASTDDSCLYQLTNDGQELSRWALFGPYPIGVAVAQDGGISASLEEGGSAPSFITKYRLDQTIETRFGTVGFGPGQFHDPSDVALDRTGNVYVTDWWNNTIQKFTSDGTFLARWYAVNIGGVFQSNQLLGLDVDADDNVYVVDSGNNRVIKFTGDGLYVTNFGGPGSGEGQFNRPTDVAVDASGNVYVTDAGNHRIQKFTRTQ